MVLIWISAKMVTTTVTANMASMANMAMARNMATAMATATVNNFDNTLKSLV